MLGQRQILNNVRFLLSYLTDKFHLRVRMFGGFVVSEKFAKLFCFVTAGRKKNQELSMVTFRFFDWKERTASLLVASYLRKGRGSNRNGLVDSSK